MIVKQTTALAHTYTLQQLSILTPPSLELNHNINTAVASDEVTITILDHLQSHPIAIGPWNIHTQSSNVGGIIMIVAKTMLA